MQTPTNSGPSCRIRLARCGSHTGHLNPKASQTRTCQTVTPKNIPPTNADQLQPKLPHQSCVLRIPKKTPLNRRSSRHAPVRLLPQKKHPACKRQPNPAQSAASELRAADPKQDTLNPKVPQTRTCRTVAPKNIQHANADQLRSKLPNQTCALRIPKGTPKP